MSKFETTPASRPSPDTTTKSHSESPPGSSRNVERYGPLPPLDLSDDEFSEQLSLNALKAYNARKRRQPSK